MPECAFAAFAILLTPRIDSNEGGIGFPEAQGSFSIPRSERRAADIAKAKQAVERLCQGTDAFAKFVGAIEDLVEARAAEIMATTEREARELDAADVEADTDAPEIEEAALETPEFDNDIDTFRAETPERKQILEDLLAFYRDEEPPCLSDNVNTAVWHALKSYPVSRKYINARMRLDS